MRSGHVLSRGQQWSRRLPIGCLLRICGSWCLPVVPFRNLLSNGWTDRVTGIESDLFGGVRFQTCIFCPFVSIFCDSWFTISSICTLDFTFLWHGIICRSGISLNTTACVICEAGFYCAEGSINTRGGIAGNQQYYQCEMISLFDHAS